MRILEEKKAIEAIQKRIRQQEKDKQEAAMKKRTKRRKRVRRDEDDTNTHGNGEEFFAGKRARDGSGSNEYDDDSGDDEMDEEGDDEGVLSSGVDENDFSGEGEVGGNKHKGVIFEDDSYKKHKGGTWNNRNNLHRLAQTHSNGFKHANMSNTQNIAPNSKGGFDLNLAEIEKDTKLLA